MNRIESITCERFSSNYGEFNSSYGQPLGVKSIVLLTVHSSKGYSRSHELYAGIYIPEIFPNLISIISKDYIGKEVSLEFINKPLKLPFLSNSGIIKSITGAIESCIIQIHFSSKGICLVDGLKTLLNPSIRREDNTKINYYGSGGSVAFSSNECLKDLKKSIEKGLDGFKMRCGLKEINKDISRVEEVYKYINDINKDKRPFLMIDLIQGTLKSKFNLLKLEKYIRRLKKYNIHWLEEPLDPDRIDLYEKFIINQADHINLCLGESFTCLNEYAAYKDLINFFQLDVTHLGGYIESINILNYMKEYKPNTRFSSHIWGSGVSGLLNLAICRAANTISWFEVPLLNFEINLHIFNKKEINYSNLDNYDIDNYLSNLNLENNPKFAFIENSGYRI